MVNCLSLIMWIIICIHPAHWIGYLIWRICYFHIDIINIDPIKICYDFLDVGFGRIVNDSAGRIIKTVMPLSSYHIRSMLILNSADINISVAYIFPIFIFQRIRIHSRSLNIEICFNLLFLYRYFKFLL